MMHKVRIPYLTKVVNNIITIIKGHGKESLPIDEQNKESLFNDEKYKESLPIDEQDKESLFNDGQGKQSFTQ